MMGVCKDHNCNSGGSGCRRRGKYLTLTGHLLAYICMFADATCAMKLACIYGAVLWHFSDCVGCVEWYLFCVSQPSIVHHHHQKG